MGALVEINPHPWITTNRFYLSVDRSVILKVYCPKRAGFSHYKYRVMRLFGYRIPYEFRSGVERCQHEREICAHWYASGYKVPRIIDDAALPLPARTAVLMPPGHPSGIGPGFCGASGGNE